MARLDLLTWSEIGAASSVHFPPLRAAFLIHCILVVRLSGRVVPLKIINDRYIDL